MTLYDELDAFLARRAASSYRPATVRNHRHMLTPFIRWLEHQGHTKWTTITAATIDAYILHLIAEDWKKSSRKTAACAIRRFGRWLLDAGKVLRDPTTDITLPTADEDPLPPAPLSEEQVAVLFATVGRASVVDFRLRLHLELLYSCALRNAEAIHLDVTDLDLDARTVLVRDGKGGKSRLVPMLASTLHAASDYLALRRELLHGPDHGALLLGVSGRRLPQCSIQNHLHALSKTIGFHVHPHLLRHSIAVHLLRRGTDIRIIQQFLGHESLETTKVYLRLVPGQLRQDYDAAMPVFPIEPPPITPITTAGGPTGQADQSTHNPVQGNNP